MEGESKKCSWKVTLNSPGTSLGARRGEVTTFALTYDLYNMCSCLVKDDELICVIRGYDVH